MEVGEVSPCADQSSSSWLLHSDHITFKTGLPLSQSGEWVCQMWGRADLPLTVLSQLVDFRLFYTVLNWHTETDWSSSITWYTAAVWLVDMTPWLISVNYFARCAYKNSCTWALWFSASSVWAWSDIRCFLLRQADVNIADLLWSAVVDALSIFRCWHHGFRVSHF